MIFTNTCDKQNILMWEKSLSLPEKNKFIIVWIRKCLILSTFDFTYLDLKFYIFVAYENRYVWYGYYLSISGVLTCCEM